MPGLREATTIPLYQFMRFSHYLGMEHIDQDWLQHHLGSDWGSRARLAQQTGISADKISKILNGTRQVQAREVPLIYRFFYPDGATGLSDDDQQLLELWRQLSPAERDYLLKSAKGLLSPLPLVNAQSGSDEE